MWAVITAGITLGFISSFHCVGMCGPLLMALPVQALPIKLQKPAIILYHTGRVLMYVFLGCIFGIAGRHIYMAGLQQWLSIITGAIIVIVVLKQVFIRKKLWRPDFVFFNIITKYIQRLWQNISLVNFFFLGALNGLLPCGMVYFALAAAVATGTIIYSSFFMLAFGSATLPLLLLLHFTGRKYLNLKLRNMMRKSVPALLMGLGVLLILRGLNLGIPYISPFLGKQPSSIVSCH